MRITELGGHSGCQVLLSESENGDVYVRKVAGETEYNERLIRQAEKQKLFENNVIHAPKVLRSGYTDEGCFYFDMEYIHGITMSEFMKTVEVGKIRGLVERITHNLVKLDSTAQVNEAIFQEKIMRLREDVSPWKDPTLELGLKRLEAHSWSKFSNTPCHGDLTLENIIVKGDQLYLIDFLDSFYDSWILDMGTLLQDVQMLWAYRNQSQIEINTLIRLIVFRDILLDEMKQIAGIEYITEMYYALLLKLIRVYPYTVDAKTRDFLDEKINFVMKLIDEVDP